MTEKKKILFVNEASYLNSGFANYGRELISRVNASGKYKVAELSNYGMVNDARDSVIRWKCYPNAVPPNDPRHQQYSAAIDNQWGRWRLDTVLLDFKPDIVANWSDPWMMMYQMRTPLYKYFNHVIMPTVDSEPQKDVWIDYFCKADKILSYSKWGLDVLAKQGGKLIKDKLWTNAGFGVEDYMQVHDRNEMRDKHGLPQDILLIGTLMRNQPRKLFPDLFNAFRQTLDKLPAEKANKTWLLCHTSHMDRGWNLSRELQYQGVANRVLFTYCCANPQCKKFHFSPWQGFKKYCPRCNQFSCMAPNVQNGLSREELSELYSMLDLYVQYANCLGKDEEILTDEGWKKISEVEIGDMAWTHKGRWKKIVNKFRNLEKSKNSRVFKVTVWGDYEYLIATEDHEFPAYTKNEIKPDKNRSIREKFGDYLRLGKSLPNMGKYELADLTPGDLLMYKIDREETDVNQLDLYPYISDRDKVVGSEIVVNHINKYNRFITVDKDFCRFMGLYVADGSSYISKTTNGGNVKLTSNTAHTSNIEIAKTVLGRFGNLTKERVYHNGNACDTILSSFLHSKFFKQEFGTGVTKGFPVWVEKLPIEKQKEIVQGMFMADGHYIQHRNASVYCTISKKLADQLKLMLRRIGVEFACRTRTKEGNRHIQYVFELYGHLADGDFPTNSRSTTNKIYEDIHYLKIKSIEEIKYTDDVHCVDVEEDHTFTTRLGTVHNCEGFGLPIVEAAACGTQTAVMDVTAMKDYPEMLNAIALQPVKMHLSVGEDAYRAIPDNVGNAEKMAEFLRQPLEKIIESGVTSSELARKNYNWNDIAQRWMDCFDSLPSTQDRWNAPKDPPITPINIPKEATSIDIVRGCSKHSGYPFDENSVQGMELVRDARNGVTMGDGGPKNFGNEDLLRVFGGFADARNTAEAVRVGEATVQQEDYLEYAKIKEEIYSNDKRADDSAV